MKLKKQLCPVCNIKSARTSDIYGVLPCLNCHSRQHKARLPDHPVEMIGESIRNQRKEYANHIIQPWRSGEPSREFIEQFPHKAKDYYTKKEMKNAKRIWSDLNYYDSRNKK